MHLVLKNLTESDLDFVKEVYDYYILNTTATFHTEPVSIAELKKIIAFENPKLRSYVVECDGDLAGYAYFSNYKDRQAYDRSAEVTLYLRPEFKGRGIGKQLLGMLEKEAVACGKSVLLGIITGENQESIALFEKCGYTQCAHFKQVGEKFGRVLDVVAYQKIINDL